MEPAPHRPARRRLLTGAAALAASAALTPLTSATAGAAAHRRTPPGGTYPPVEWIPASPGNFTTAKRPTQYPIETVVVHVTQETYADTLKLFQDPAHKAAAHYVVRSADGYIARCVRERDVAWHAGNWNYNTRSIGIEHEGWIDDPTWFTDPLYEQSALLTAAICDRYRIPKDREHIIGHVEVPGTDHTDPGEFWDWARYLHLVNEVSWQHAG
ncbi:N-acetylmuramoyl-L-alanine amidase [Streptomyces sp. SID8375]|uniref:N-acetylmuramoyl-L-alanine amidase n=1 Tax=unclassified Streptomyces TaxID=2593676 RepID=UPI00037C3AFA|nr:MULTISPECIES: N-acetylmuramoyl-L-alanine amidase [unclassified Streptomyces]MCW7990468.1 amidase [Streptomyces platensis subsp. clarensis]MYX05384.1 N-acetylmuramoyl-L-alanine amidase [Streptomyces sp. SID8375]